MVRASQLWYTEGGREEVLKIMMTDVPNRKTTLAKWNNNQNDWITLNRIFVYKPHI